MGFSFLMLFNLMLMAILFYRFKINKNKYKRNYLDRIIANRCADANDFLFSRIFFGISLLSFELSFFIKSFFAS